MGVASPEIKQEAGDFGDDTEHPLLAAILSNHLSWIAANPLKRRFESNVTEHGKSFGRSK